MSFNNPVMPWRELNRTLSWAPHGELTLAESSADADADADAAAAAERNAGPDSTRPAPPPRPAGPVVPYAELHAHSAYSFLDGASSPRELVAEAQRLGLSALAVTDHDGLYGAVQLAQADRKSVV